MMNIEQIAAGLGHRNFTLNSDGRITIDPENFQGWDQAAADAWSPPAPKLTPKQFEWLLAISGLDDVWDATQQAAKANGDTESYAFVKAQRASQSFVLQDVLDAKNMPAMQAIAAQVAPGADISDERIMTLWDQAASQFIG